MSTLQNRRIISAASELFVCADLLERGFQVFRNVADSGPGDLVVWSPDTAVKEVIDVKTVNSAYRKVDGTVTNQYPEQNKETKAWFVVVRYGNIHYPTGLSKQLGVNLPQWAGNVVHGPLLPNCMI